MENKQTAVEWLENELARCVTATDERIVFRIAKAMEKEQIEEAFNNSSWFIDGKEYYDKTYGN